MKELDRIIDIKQNKSKKYCKLYFGMKHIAEMNKSYFTLQQNTKLK